MRKAANVRSIEAIRSAKVALADFREVAGVAISEAQSDVQRTVWWVQNEQKTRWTHEIKRRTEKVNQAKSELFRAQMSSVDGRPPSCIEQKKMLQRAERALEEARMKLEHVKKWSRLLDREYMLFKAKLQPISRAVDGDLPRGEAKLDLMLERLEAYVRMPPPVTDAATKSTSSSATGVEGSGDGSDRGAEPASGGAS
jgi:hypothetical protein